jgi:hypothetical protein
VLNAHGVHDVRQMDIHMAEPLVPEPSLVKVEIAIAKLKSYKSPVTDQIPAKLIIQGVKHYILRYTGGIAAAVEGVCQFIRRVIRLIVIIIKKSPSYQLPIKYYPTFFWPG